MLVAEETVEIRVESSRPQHPRHRPTLSVSRNMVRRYFRHQGLPRYRRKPRATKLDTFKQRLRSVQGVATGVACESAECESLKPIFLKKEPFEAVLRQSGLRMITMIKVISKRVSYASDLKDAFKAAF